jgi:hypothetical protein
MPLKQKNAKLYRSFDFGVSYRIGENRDRFKDALNVYSNQGRLETRFGRSLYNSTLLSGPVLSLSFFKTSSGVRYVLAKVGTSLYSIATSGAHTAIKTGLSAGTKHRGISWSRGSSSRHIISIEDDGLFQWDGADFTQLGQDPPVGHTVAITTGTLTNGTYRVHLTFYSSTTGFESNSSYSSEVTTTTDGILVDDIPTTADNATIDKVRIYLEDMASPDDPAFVAELALGNTNYTISEDPSSTETRPISSAKPLSGGGKFLTEFNGRLVYAGNDNYRNDVYFSEQDLPDAFNDGTGPDRLVHYAKGNGQVTGLATGLYNNSVLDPYLVIFKERSIEIFSGISGEERAIPISHQIGCVSHETIQVKNGDVYFLSDNGWRVISNGRLITGDNNNPVTLGNGDIDDIFQLPGMTYEINKSQAVNAFSAYYSTLDQYMTWVPEGGSTDFTKTYVFEFKTGGFKPYEFNTASTAACTGENSDGAEVVFMGDANGAVYTHSIREEKASDDDSLGDAYAVNSFALLPWLEGEDMDSSFSWRDITLKRVDGSRDLTMRAFVNYSSDEALAQPITFPANDSGFALDISVLDEDALVESGRSIEKSRADINLNGETLLIGFYQNKIGASIALVSAQISFNRNGNQN